VEHVGGFPVILKPAYGGGFKKVYKLWDFEGLFHAYDETGTDCMMLQEFIEWENYARCICIGQDKILPIKFDINRPFPPLPGRPRGSWPQARATGGLGDQIPCARYDEHRGFAIRDGVLLPSTTPGARLRPGVADRALLPLGGQRHGRPVHRPRPGQATAGAGAAPLERPARGRHDAASRGGGRPRRRGPAMSYYDPGSADFPFTMGIEEEFQIIDPATGGLQSYVSEILEDGKLILMEQVKPERWVGGETGTHVCRTDDAQADPRLRATIAALAARRE
jgi:hypothetical protein